jgi:DUF1680 family protein
MHTALMDSIYFYDGTTLIVNMFLPSVLTWSRRGITVTQTTSYPVGDTTNLQVTGNVSGTWSMRLRIPCWTTGATIRVNGTVQNTTTAPGSYATLTRSWNSGDTVTLQRPMRVILGQANDNPNVAAVTYGPTVLSGDYGNTSLNSPPALNTSSITRTSNNSLPSPPPRTAPWSTSAVRFRNAHSGKVLGIENNAASAGAFAVQDSDNGTADNRWRVMGNNQRVRLIVVNPLAAASSAPTAAGVAVVATNCAVTDAPTAASIPIDRYTAALPGCAWA